jgi:hypothetical protein
LPVYLPTGVLRIVWHVIKDMQVVVVAIFM